jgi:hypothetical protein
LSCGSSCQSIYTNTIQPVSKHFIINGIIMPSFTPPRRGKRSSLNGQSRKLKFDATADEADILYWVEAAIEQTQFSSLGFDEVTITPEIAAGVVDLFRRTSRYGRVFDRLSVEFCDGFAIDLMITTPLILDGIKHLFIATDTPEEALVGRIATTLRLNTSLLSLWLLLPFTEASASALAGALRDNETLEKLSLSGSNFDKLDDEDDDDDRTKSDIVSLDNTEFSLFNPWDTSMALSEGLGDNVSLKIIDLSCCYLRDDVLAQIVSALAGHPSLHTLDISRNAGRELTMHALSKVVGHHNTKLINLDVRQQTEDVPVDISELSQALRNNSTLESLKLSHNRLMDTHVIGLVECLEGNDSIQELDLQYNLITENGLNYLTEHLSGIKSLAVLLLGGNAFGPDGRNLLESLQDDDQSICTVNEKELAKKKKQQEQEKARSPGSKPLGSRFLGFSGFMGVNKSAKELKRG